MTGNLEAILQRAEKAHVVSETNLWVVAFCSAEIVGKFDPGVTIQLAKRLKLSSPHIRRLAGAYVTYCFLKGYIKTPGWQLAIRKLRAGLTVSHFGMVGELMRRYEFSPEEAVAFLHQASEEGISVNYLRSLIEGEMDKNPQDDWAKSAPSLVSGLRGWAYNYGVPDELRLLVKDFLTEFVDKLKALGIEIDA